MTVNNINNSAAQLQFYANEKANAQKPAVAVAPQETRQANPATQSDSVQISDQAQALLLKDTSPIDAVSPLSNGMGIEPPKGN